MNFLSHNLLILLGALLLDAAFGYPDWLFRAIRHPVVWMGQCLGWMERRCNGGKRWQGIAVLLVLLTVTAVPTALIQYWLADSFAGLAVLALVVSSLPAQRSLYRHVAAVADALDVDIAQARRAVSQIVGRDPDKLDQFAIARAAIESLAENFSDGIVAPAFWCAVGGLPLMAVYKAINTADSMIGHLSPRYRRFGWAAARLDDVANLPASRLSALLLLGAALCTRGDARGAMRAMLRDAQHHRSPNAGWPEAAMAGALRLRLAGPRHYHGEAVMDGWMGDGRVEATARDIRDALALYRAACIIQIVWVALLAAITAYPLRISGTDLTW